MVRDEERLVFGSVDAVPGIARHQPAFRRFVLERVDVFGFARQKAHHLAPLEQAADVAFTHEARKISAEQHVENRVRPRVREGLHHGAGLDTAQGRRLLTDEFHIRLRFLELLLERGDRRLPVFVIGIHHHPTLLLHLRRFRHQHGGLHVGRCAQAEGVFVAVLPDDLVRQGFGGEKKHLFLLGEIGQREPDVRQEATGQEVHFLTRNQFLGDPYRISRVAAVVADHHLDLAPRHAAGGVDLFERQVHAFLVRVQEGRLRLVTVDLADPNRLLLRLNPG